ncbi:MAG: hypothetical protein FK732_11135 [Asgard group archaeon]|nr:hypothetical protein [Asgard group archaeon]
MVMSSITYKDTLQFVINAKILPSEVMKLPNIKNKCKTKLARKGNQIMRTNDDNKVTLLYHNHGSLFSRGLASK